MPLFAATIFTGAFLLFLVQPLIGKFVLPWFGGGAGVWGACLVFFQVGLLAGYAYADALVRWLSPKRQAAVHTVVLAAALAFLPIVPSASWRPDAGDDPGVRILLLLAATIGLPYIALAATGPLVQAWFARAFRGTSPYRLFALSNAGSLLPLLAFPFLIEPEMTRRGQAYAWSGLFVLFAAACALLAWRASRHDALPRGKGAHDGPRGAPSALDRVLWFLLPACASMILLASTHKLSEEVAPVPLLWVLPLAVYLLTFIVAFEWPRAYLRPVVVPALVGASWLAATLIDPGEMGIRPQIAGHLAVVFVCCLACHGEVYRKRPAPARLTGYYLAVAAGGAAGGVFVALIAPRIFVNYVDYDIGVVASVVLVIASILEEHRAPAGRRVWATAGAAALILTAVAGWRMHEVHLRRAKGALVRERNFYGTLKVVERDHGNPQTWYTRLEVGRILHGAQIHRADLRRKPTLYYTAISGIGRLFAARRTALPRRVGVVGLGVGTIATFGRAGDTFRFYEINPADIRVAREDFTFLSDSPATIEVVRGDGRLSLEREPDQHFDILVLDAFNGDAIPTHLLTREAFATYVRHLAPGGAIVVNVINRYVDLARVVVPLAESLGFTVRDYHSPPEPGRLVTEANWLILSRDPTLFETAELAGGTPPSPQDERRTPWTDDFVSLAEVLR